MYEQLQNSIRSALQKFRCCMETAARIEGARGALDVTGPDQCLNLIAGAAIAGQRTPRNGSFYLPV
jgi:hypothetical protein